LLGKSEPFFVQRHGRSTSSEGGFAFPKWFRSQMSPWICDFALGGEMTKSRNGMGALHEAQSEREQRLIAFLRSRSSYPHCPAQIHLHETHISWVFIASPFVFKVKKPVALGFLDFSTIEKRRHFCRGKRSHR
jgi:hypothetical protein